MKGIVERLQELDPVDMPEYFSAEKALERFWKYYELRQYEEEHLQIQGEVKNKFTESV